MAMQRYFQRSSRYWTASCAWLEQVSHQGGLDNFGALTTTVETLIWDTAVYWPVELPNRSASYLRNGGPEGLLVLGPHTGPLPNYGEIQIPDSCFFYEDERVGLLEKPIHLEDTPFLLRGMATGLKERLHPEQTASKPFVFWVRYDGNPNRQGVLKIRRHQW